MYFPVSFLVVEELVVLDFEETEVVSLAELEILEVFVSFRLNIFILYTLLLSKWKLNKKKSCSGDFSGK